MPGDCWQRLRYASCTALWLSELGGETAGMAKIGLQGFGKDIALRHPPKNEVRPLANDRDIAQLKPAVKHEIGMG